MSQVELGLGFDNFVSIIFSYIEQVLSMIEIVEVFLEIAANRFGGPTAKWAVIVAIQVLK